MEGQMHATSKIVNPNEHKTFMLKIGLFAVATAFILARIGAWAASTTRAGVEAAIEDHRIDPFQIMLNVKDLPVEHWDGI